MTCVLDFMLRNINEDCEVKFILTVTRQIVLVNIGVRGDLLGENRILGMVM